MRRLGLHMIVKDEAPVIERCLRSVLPLVSWWVVSDTGSTDGTQELVRRTMDGARPAHRTPVGLFRPQPAGGP